VAPPSGKQSRPSKSLPLTPFSYSQDAARISYYNHTASTGVVTADFRRPWHGYHGHQQAHISLCTEQRGRNFVVGRSLEKMQIPRHCSQPVHSAIQCLLVFIPACRFKDSPRFRILKFRPDSFLHIRNFVCNNSVYISSYKRDDGAKTIKLYGGNQSDISCSHDSKYKDNSLLECDAVYSVMNLSRRPKNCCFCPHDLFRIY